MFTVNIDLDGVVYRWHEVMAEWVWLTKTGVEWNPYETRTGIVWEEEEHWPLPFPAPNKWNFEHDWGLKEAEFYSMFRKGVEAGYVWRAGEPVTNSVEGLWELDAGGAYIRLVTKRLVHKFNHALIQKSTVEWLDKWNVPYHEIAYLGKYSSKGEFRCEYALDDNPQHIREYGRVGLGAHLLTRPWNENIKLNKSARRVASWDEFVADVLATR